MISREFNVKKHYSWEYDSKNRFISYWHQIREVLKTNPKKVLEIGIGNSTVTNYLKMQAIEVVTVDIKKDLNPDYVCSVTDIDKYFKEYSFDTILCAEVLEHIPFEDFGRALNKMHKIVKNYVIISLPHFGINFRFSFKIPLRKERNLLIKIPLPIIHKFDGEHYWEIGKKGYSLNRILKIFSKFFDIEKEFLVPETPSHHLFVLRKK